MVKLKNVSQDIFNELKKAKSILCPVHINPDGDAISSVLAMNNLLKKMGKKVKVTSSDKLPQNLTSLKGIREIEIKDFADLDLPQFDLIVFMDISELNRFTKRSDFKIPKKMMTINIDHHPKNTNFAKINAVFPGFSSAAQILYEIFKFQKVKIDKDLAHHLYLGIYTDTGGLEFGVFPKTLRAVAELLEKGASHNQIVFELSRGKSLPILKSWGKILTNLKIDKQHRFCWSTLAYKDFLEINCQPSDYYGATGFIKQVKGTDFGFLLIEETPGRIRGNLRSRRQIEEGGFDVSQIAFALGGGGHKPAAGFRLKMSLKEAERKVLKAAREFARKQK